MKFPKDVYVYASYCDRKAPLFTVVASFADIPEWENGQLIATYRLVATGKLRVAKTVLSTKKSTKP